VYYNACFLPNPECQVEGVLKLALFLPCRVSVAGPVEVVFDFCAISFGRAGRPG
jgi:hypothetical protein